MHAALLLEGLALGFAIAAPVGPIGILVIHRTLESGRRIGFLSSLGAATADAFYGFYSLIESVGLAWAGPATPERRFLPARLKSAPGRVLLKGNRPRRGRLEPRGRLEGIGRHVDTSELGFRCRADGRRRGLDLRALGR